MQAWCMGVGQERSVMPSAQHTACTIEMTNLLKRVDVAVIDEIQVRLAAPKHLTTLSPADCFGCLMLETWQVLLCWSTLPRYLSVVKLRGSG